MSVTTTRLVERARVPVGPPPHAHIGYAASHDAVWVLNSSGVSVLDGASGTSKAEVSLGGKPTHLIIDDAGGRAYITVDDQLVILDLAGQELEHLQLPSGPASVLVPMPPTNRMYVLSQAGGALDVVDTGTGQVVKTVPTGRGSAWGQPHGNSCGKLYIANADSDDVTVIDESSETVIATLGVGRRPHRNGIFRERDLVYNADYDDGTVTGISISGDRVVATIPVGEHPFRLVGVEKKVGRPELWVLNRGSEARPEGVISIVNVIEQRVISTVQVMDRPSNWLFKGATLHVVGSRNRELRIVDAHSASVVGSAQLSEDPDPASHSNMVFNSAGHLFIANDGESVSIFVRGS
jgi:YVTN family beta-propeller protein